MATYNGTLKKWNQAGAAWDVLYPKTTAENIISGTLDAARIPSLDAGKIGSGTLDAARIPTLDAAKIGSGTLNVARIPSLDAGKIGSGTLDAARIPSLDAGKIGSGTLDAARIPSLDAGKIGSGTLDAARIPTLDAGKIGSGTINAARLPAIAITNSVTYTTLAAFVTAYQANHDLVQLGDIVILTTDKKTYIHNGGTAYTSADLTLLQTPTDLVSSVNGYVGVVNLEGNDLGIGGSSGNYYGNQDTIADSLRSVDSQVATNVTAIAGKEPSFSKNTAFNKNFGTTAGTVAQGDDSRFLLYNDRDTRKFGASANDYFEMDGQTIKVYSDGQFVMQINHLGTAHDMKNLKLINVHDPLDAQDAATKNYVDTHQLMLADALPTTGLVDGQMGFEY